MTWSCGQQVTDAVVPGHRAQPVLTLLTARNLGLLGSVGAIGLWAAVLLQLGRARAPCPEVAWSSVEFCGCPGWRRRSRSC